MAKGFSLIELLVVIGLIVLISAFAIPNISNYFRLSVNSAARDLGTTVKEAYNATVMTGKVHRMAYDIKKSEYWVESGPATILLDTAQSKEREERRKRLKGAPSDGGDQEEPSPFSIEKTITRKKLSLPRGVVFEDIVTQQASEPLTDGIAHTHFFPHGLTEQAVIHLKDDSKHQISLVISPLVGRTDLYEKYIGAAEAFSR